MDVEREHKRLIDFYNNDQNYFNMIKKENDFKDIYNFIKKNIFKREQILDVGCGTGNLINFLKNKGYKSVLGVDASQKFISNIKSKKVFCSDFLKFETKETFKLIIMKDFIEHSINIEQIFNKSKKLLSPDGFLIIKSPNLSQVISRRGINLKNFKINIKKAIRYYFKKKLSPEYIKPKLNKITYLNGDSDACYMTNIFDLKQILNNAKFNIKKINYCNQKICNIIKYIPFIREIVGPFFIIAKL